MKLSDKINLELTKDEAYSLHRFLVSSYRNGWIACAGLSKEQSESLIELHHLFDRNFSRNLG